MCLAIPSKIVKIENHAATIDVDGVRREASLMLLENLKVGDYVIVHAARRFCHPQNKRRRCPGILKTVTGNTFIDVRRSRAGDG